MGLFRSEKTPEVHSIDVTLYTCRGCLGLGEMTQQQMIQHIRLLPAHQSLIEASKGQQNLVTTHVEKSGVASLASATNKLFKWMDSDDSSSAHKKKKR